MDAESYKNLLGEDLFDLTRTVDSPLIEAIPLSTSISSQLEKGAFLFKFRNGKVLKGRRFESVKHAQKVYELWSYFNLGILPEILSLKGCAMLTEWVDGTNLLPDNLTPELARRCGLLHGLVHSIEIPEQIIDKYKVHLAYDKSQFFTIISQQIEEIVKYDYLNNSEARMLMDLVERNYPDDFSLGLVCGDFCNENLVLNGDEKIYFIDNESISIDDFDHDLARTYYRWPMTEKQRSSYFEGYHNYRGSERFYNHYYFWIIKVLIKSIHYNLHAATLRELHALKVIKSILKDLDSAKFKQKSDYSNYEELMTLIQQGNLYNRYFEYNGLTIKVASSDQQPLNWILI